MPFKHRIRFESGGRYKEAAVIMQTYSSREGREGLGPAFLVWSDKDFSQMTIRRMDQEFLQDFLLRGLEFASGFEASDQEFLTNLIEKASHYLQLSSAPDQPPEGEQIDASTGLGTSLPL